MPRPLRVHYRGAVLRVVSRGSDRLPLFEKPADYRYFLEGLESVRERFPFALHAYVLLPDQVQLVVEVGEVPLARIMQAVLTRYAAYYNRTRSRSGHLFAGRYRAALLQRERYLLPVVRRVHEEPVRAGAAQSPGAWPWSSHGEYLGRSGGPAETRAVLEALAREGRTYEDFMAEGTAGEGDLEPAAGAPVLGDEAFREGLSSVLWGASRRPSPKVPLERLSELVSRAFELDPALLSAPGKARPVARARAFLSYLAVRRSSHTHAAVARFLGCTPSAVTRSLRRAPALEKDPAMAELASLALEGPGGAEAPPQGPGVKSGTGGF